MATSTRDFFTGQRRSNKPKRNFIQENIKQLREMKNKQVEPVSTKSGPFFPRFDSETNYGEMKNSKLNSGLGLKLRRDSSNLSLTNLAQSKMKDSFIREISSLPTGFRHQASQTVEENDLDSLYHEGVIRFPSTRSTDDSRGHVKLVREMGLQTEKTIIRAPSPARSESPPPPLIRNAAGDSVKDFVKYNAMVQVQPKRKFDNIQDPNRPPPNYQLGVLPKYLREHKKEQERIKDVEVAEDPDCPPGHTVLPEEERVKHLEQLKQHYTALVNELNLLPVRTDTLRTRRRRLELEKELDKIDAGIKLFSRDKLFIKNKV